MRVKERERKRREERGAISHVRLSARACGATGFDRPFRTKSCPVALGHVEFVWAILLFVDATGRTDGREEPIPISARDSEKVGKERRERRGSPARL